MKTPLTALLFILALACSNQAGNNSGQVKDNNAAVTSENPASGSKNDCSNNLLFQKGASISTTSYNGQGQVTSKGTSTVAKVYQQSGMTVSELTTKNTDGNNANEKTSTVVYKCDGNLLYIDLSGVLSDGKQANLETTGLQFPFNVSVGDTLPDSEYSINMTAGGKTRKITSHIRERKVEAKESITTSAGTFECYKISSSIEAETSMPGMDEKSKQIMDEVKKRTGKNVMTFWYAPAVTIIKMEYHTGNKLIIRSEVTDIKKY